MKPAIIVISIFVIVALVGLYFCGSNDGLRFDLQWFLYRLDAKRMNWTLRIVQPGTRIDSLVNDPAIGLSEKEILKKFGKPESVYYMRAALLPRGHRLSGESAPEIVGPVYHWILTSSEDADTEFLNYPEQHMQFHISKNGRICTASEVR